MNKETKKMITRIVENLTPHDCQITEQPWWGSIKTIYKIGAQTERHPPSISLCKIIIIEINRRIDALRHAAWEEQYEKEKKIAAQIGGYVVGLGTYSVPQARRPEQDVRRHERVLARIEDCAQLEGAKK